MASRRILLPALLLLALPAAAQESATAAGMDAVIAEDWVAACEAFAKAEGDPRAGLRVSAARKQAMKQLGPAIDQLVKEKRWRQLAEATACGLVVDAKHYRFGSALKRLEKEGITEVPALDARVRCWATYGPAFAEAQSLVEGCLDWLVKTQEPEGHWDSGKHGGGELFDAGVSALALLALLPHRREAADRAAAALLKMQHRDGYFGTLQTHSWIYNHCLATEALAEHALVAGKKEEYREALQRAADYIVAAQNTGSGWRYEPRGGENDTCVTVRAASALHAAERAGARVSAEALRGALAWVEGMTDKDFGQIGYNYPGGAPARPQGKQDLFPPEHSQAMTAAGCVVYMLCGTDPAMISKSFAMLQTTPPTDRFPDLYYWELGTRAFVTGQAWIPGYWYDALVKGVTACRAGDGGAAPKGVWGDDGGRVYANAMCVLALSAPYLYAPPQKLSASQFLQTRKRALEVAGWAWATPTGIYVESGTVLQVDARGTIVPFARGPGIGPEGTRERLAKPSKPRASRSPFGCLLACVDDGDPFPLDIGKRNTIRVGYGHLWLLPNDQDYIDNVGSWQVTIELVR